jgi:aryl-alcohol dehydrogenase-like predicted oxidoreductase
MSEARTGLLGGKQIARVGFGAMQLAGPGVFGPPPDPQAACAVLRRAVELGVDHIDTAQYYGPDGVNELIREALHPYPPGLKLVTKVGARRDARGAWLPASSPRELREGVEANLRSLRIERLDLVNLRLMPGAADGTPELADQLGELDALRREGKLDLVGISSVTREIAEQALELSEIACVQNAYSLIERESAPVIELCRERGLAFVAYFPLGSAFTGGPARISADPVIRDVAARHGATPAQVALAWLLHSDERILLIPGTTSVAHLEENVAAGELQLDGEDMARLDAVAPVDGGDAGG